MPKSKPLAERLTIDLKDWPAVDRLLWENGVAERRKLTQRTYASNLRQKSIQKFREGYGRWLGFLAKEGRLNTDLAPDARVTYEMVGCYFEELQLIGNKPATIVGRMAELQYALKILTPLIDFSWITTPGGATIEGMLPKARRQKSIFHPTDVFEWGLDMMRTADALPSDRRSVAFRDGLALAIQAFRAPRLRSFMSMELGKSVIISGSEVTIRFDEDEMKTHCPLTYPLEAMLTPFIHRYLDVERPNLLKGSHLAAFWVSRDGSALSARGMQVRIRRLTAKKFGKSIGIHSFRHGLGTITPALFPNNPAIAAAVLGISAKMVNDHYDRGQVNVAAAGLSRALDDERRATALAAREALTDCAQCPHASRSVSIRVGPIGDS